MEMTDGIAEFWLKTVKNNAKSLQFDPDKLMTAEMCFEAVKQRLFDLFLKNTEHQKY